MNLMISHHTPPKSNVTTEKQPFEDVIKHLLKNRDFPASRVIVFGDVFARIWNHPSNPTGTCFFFNFWDAICHQLGESKVRALRTHQPKPLILLMEIIPNNHGLGCF